MPYSGTMYQYDVRPSRCNRTMTFWTPEVLYPITMQQCNGKVHFKGLKYCFPVTSCHVNAAETSVIRSIPVTDRLDPGSGKDNFQPDLVTSV